MVLRFCDSLWGWDCFIGGKGNPDEICVYVFTPDEIYVCFIRGNAVLGHCLMFSPERGVTG